MYVYKVIPKKLSHNTGPFARDVPACFNRRLVATLYVVSIVAEREHARKSWMARVKHTMLRLSQNITT